jgi:predicted translin family RNA/ssDNA-binding protein
VACKPAKPDLRHKMNVSQIVVQIIKNHVAKARANDRCNENINQLAIHIFL